MARPLGTTGKAQVLSEKEFKRVIAFVKGHYGEKFELRNRAILYVSFYLGLRVSEIASLCISHVYESGGSVKPVIRLTAPMTKSKRHRDVFTSNPVLIKILAEYYSFMDKIYGGKLLEEMPLFQSQKGGKFSAKTLGRLIKDIYALAGFKEASSHSGRRSMITSLIDNGIDIKAVSVIAGHTSITTTAIYAESSPAKLSNIMKTVFRRV